jgi:hypothetical protein
MTKMKRGDEKGSLGGTTGVNGEGTVLVKERGWKENENVNWIWNVQ